MSKSYFILSFFLLQITVIGFAQISETQVIKDINEFRTEKDNYFKDPETSPLKPNEITAFKGIEYFSIDLKYRVKASFKKYDRMKLFYMKTTTDRLPKYGRYGELTFKLEGKEYKLQVYQNQSLMETTEYENYLFIPFTDLTSGDISYGGGRYFDMDIPTGNEVILDFNKTYNPYCAYNSKYSCPVPPRENNLNVEILAGVKAPDESKY